MLTTFLATLEQMSRILLLLSVGYCLNRFHILPKSAESVLSRLVTTLFLPCLMLYTNIAECRITSLLTYGSLVFAGLAICLGTILLSYPLARFFGGKDPFLRGVYRYALAFPNTGAVATPLVLAFFGTAGLFRFNLFWFSAMIATYTWGIAQLLPSGHKVSLQDHIKKCLNPTTVAMVAGMLLGVVGAASFIPPIVLSTIGEISNGYVIIGLIMAGFTIADYRPSQILGDKMVYLYAATRLLVLPIAITGIVLLCGGSVELCTMVALALSSPSGMNAVIYPASYGQDCKVGASIVLISSACSVLTIPFIYALLQLFI